ncbi:MAG: ribosome small subunit-dependent GTPase A, partial [Angelakisella sp.]
MDGNTAILKNNNLHNNKEGMPMINLQDYGFYKEQLLEENGIPARVTAVHKERYEVICPMGTTHGRLKSSIYFGSGQQSFPTVGDFVVLEYNSTGDSMIVETLPRSAYFSRRDPTPGRGEQAVAANFDYVFIIASLNMDFNVKRLERYITQGWQSGATPVILLTKADLVDDDSSQRLAAQSVAAGVDILAVSAHTGYGMETLEKYLQPGKTAVLLGSSGAGKSSLVNALAGNERMTVSDIREDDSKGRHTTTHRQLIMLPSGAMIIDTPGMRELGMWDVSSGLGEAFTDITQTLGKCRFSDCTHGNEPGCAVRQAIEEGVITGERWNSYLKLKNEARYSDDKAAYLQDVRQKGK